MTPTHTSTRVLAGWNVLVTRPADQANGLCALIEAAGGRAVRFPLIAIQPSDTADRALELLGRAKDWNWLIFVSAHAVRYASDLGDWWRALPAHVRIAAIGRGTAKSLAAAGLRVDLTPEAQFNSEALLDSPQLQTMAGQRVLIVRGRGGRELIADTLRRRGAAVDYAEVYQRVSPNGDASALIAEWRRGAINALTVTSGEALENLANLLGANDSDLLRQTPIAVIGERLAANARERGCQRVEVAAEASDEGLRDSVIRLAHST